MLLSDSKGFTLIELIISMAILSIIAAAISYQGLMADQALKHRAEQVYFTLQLAKTEAVKRNKKIYVNFCQQQASWRIGMSEQSSCDCFTENSCQLGGVEKVQALVDGEELFIDNGAITFSDSQASYNPLRFSVETGTVTITNSEQKSLSIKQGTNRLRICAPGAPGLGHAEC